jgi:hypothetical protein
MTLAGWDESPLGSRRPRTSKGSRIPCLAEKSSPALAPALLENPSVEQEALLELAPQAPLEW